MSLTADGQNPESPSVECHCRFPSTLAYPADYCTSLPTPLATAPGPPFPAIAISPCRDGRRGGAVGGMPLPPGRDEGICQMCIEEVLRTGQSSAYPTPLVPGAFRPSPRAPRVVRGRDKRPPNHVPGQAPPVRLVSRRYSSCPLRHGVLCGCRCRYRMRLAATSATAIASSVLLAQRSQAAKLRSVTTIF